MLKTLRLFQSDDLSYPLRNIQYIRASPFVRHHIDLQPYACSLKNCHRNIAHRQGEKCSYWGCQVTQCVGSATRTPDVEAVVVVPIVRRADQVQTVSSTSSRHRQVVKLDALDLGDKGGQHHAVERRHNTNSAIFDRSTCSLSSSSQLHACAEHA